MKSTFYRASRNWGAEYILYCSPSYFTLKVLFVLGGMRGGLQKHHFKDEVGLILSGTLRIRRGLTLDSLEEVDLGAGSLFSFPPGLIHQEYALTDSYILEISSPHLNDRVRFDTDEMNLLPSTLPSDIISLDEPALIPEQLSCLGFNVISYSCIPDELKKLIDIFV